VGIRKGAYTLDGQPRTDRELIEALKKAITVESGTWVLLQVPDDEPFAAINHAFEVLGAAGVRTIRLAPADASD
jgi:biopolymer transport protein ExbD